MDGDLDEGGGAGIFFGGGALLAQEEEALEPRGLDDVGVGP